MHLYDPASAWDKQGHGCGTCDCSVTGKEKVP